MNSGRTRRHPKWFFAFGAALVAAACGLGAPSLALAQGKDAVYHMSLEDLLELPVTVASKVVERLTDAPSSVTVFTGEELRRMGVTSVQELLNYVPGFQSTRDVEQGDTMRISSRGRSTYLSESVLVLVDGERLNDLYSGGAVLLNRALVTGHIEKVEIIRGPGSALYGSNAFMGVVNIKTATDTNAVDAYLGEHHAVGVAAQFAHQGEESRVSGYVGFATDDGFDYDNAVDSFGLVERQNDASGHVEAGMQAGWKGLSVHLRHTRHESGRFLTFGVNQDAGAKEHVSQDNLSVRYEVAITDSMDLQAMVFGRHDSWKATAKVIPADVDLGGFELALPAFAGPDYEAYALGGSVDLQEELFEHNQVSAGFFYEWDEIDHARTLSNYNLLTLEPLSRFGVSDSGFNNEEGRHIAGFYVQDRHVFADVLIATAGVRGDFYSDFGSSFNPRLALAYRAPFEATFKAMYGRAFRAPNYLELYDRNNPIDFGNAQLAPEVIDTVEAAWVQQIGSSIYATTTYFLNDLRDGIRFGADATSNPDNALRAPSFDNRGTQRSHGVEVEVRANPVPGYDIYGSVTSLDTLEGDPITTAVFFGALGFNAHLGDLNINMNGIWRVFREAHRRDPHLVVNARIAYQLLPELSVYLNARNVLDEAYRTTSSLLPEGVPNRGRMVMGGLRATF